MQRQGSSFGIKSIGFVLALIIVVSVISVGVTIGRWLIGGALGALVGYLGGWGALATSLWVRR